ncbi:type III-B CRISPR module RAMP protein Cmr1 [Azospirillum soli]|uniref:type III-B CRISPR module RAMP protein Cmr1 n=1 Tax=Azospirillum soli TaxID=1304799 RepID=UPI001AE24A4E|nr:type III-B CRISPR module RAMP protein Cmr1 [Azospirillum soli]MBP2310731.1 CRISPR-associated protein Cmr1 [Azospirillum soli]
MPGFQTVSATFLIATPLFLGGARQEAEGFRLASLKGALRFWWRALEYPKLFAETRSRNAALAALRRREISLFGSTGAQGSALMRLEPRRTPLPRLERDAVLRGADNRVAGPGARYLGYGLMGAFGETMGKLSRSCLLPGPCVRVHIAFKPGAPDADTASFLRALRLFGLVGGLGSRARRGWGSLALVELTGGGTPWQPPRTEEEYRSQLLALLGDLSGGEAEPPFTAFGPKVRIDLLVSAPDGLTALNRMGEAMQRYRAWGHKGMVNGVPSEKNFVDDHDWSKEPFGPRYRSFVPQRAVFGLPQNYGKGSGVAPAVPGMDRRASPLILHVHPLGADHHIAVSLLLPAQFLPGEHDEVTVTHRGRSDTRRARIDWSVLDRFLDGPADPARRREGGAYFPQRAPVLPDRR